jgi:hypothetical protein
MVRLLFGLVAALAMVMGAMAPPVGAQDGVDLRIVTIRDTNLYAEPSWDAEVLTVIPVGTVLYYQHNVSETGFMIMQYDGFDGWIPLDSFVSYADYYGTDEETDQGTKDVETLPGTGAGPGAGTSTSLPLLGVAVFGLIVAARLALKTR